MARSDSSRSGKVVWFYLSMGCDRLRRAMEARSGIRHGREILDLMPIAPCSLNSTDAQLSLRGGVQTDIVCISITKPPKQSHTSSDREIASGGGLIRKHNFTRYQPLPRNDKREFVVRGKSLTGEGITL